MKSWPYVEAQRVIDRVKSRALAAPTITFMTGFGPSGAPHIGTFAEVLRTEMVRRAFEDLAVDHGLGELRTRLVVFADDYDALRRVPDDVPNRDEMENDIGLPLSSVRDPYERHTSFAGRNLMLLRDFLHDLREDELLRDFQVYEATELYREGQFNSALLNVCQHHDDIMSIMLPTLGEERRATYSPFLPVSPRTGRILQVPVEITNARWGEIAFTDADGSRVETTVFDGNVKLQWKVDWAMRWGAFETAYEMCGKDLTDSYRESSKIARVLGHEPPQNMIYEMFLDENGEKISKSKGNGLSIEQWMRYGTLESLALYMYGSPTSAKRLHVGVIPRAVEDYYKALKTFHEQRLNPNQKEAGEKQRDNPVWHIHCRWVPEPLKTDLTYGLLVNLAAASPGISQGDLVQMLINSGRAPSQQPDTRHVAVLTGKALRYCQDFVHLTMIERQRAPTDAEKAAFYDLAERIEIMEKGLDPEVYQAVVYAVGNEHGFEPLRSWFQGLYEVLFGDSQGPRFGAFIAAYGPARTAELLRAACARQPAVEEAAG